MAQEATAETQNLPSGQALLDLVNRIKPSAVTVIMSDAAGTDVASTSGFFIDESLIVTNHQAVAMGVAGRIQLMSGEMLNISDVVASNVKSNLVLVSINRPDHLDAAKTLPLPVASDPLAAGNEVLMISSPLGRQQVVARGVVGEAVELEGISGGHDVDMQFVTGSTGSPILNAKGEVVAVAAFVSNDGEARKFALSIGVVTAMRDDAAGSAAMSLAAYSKEFGPADAASRSASTEPLKLEATFTKQADGSLLIDEKYTVTGSGTKEDPYRLPWSLLVSAARVYEPREGRNELPERVTFLNGKWVQMDGFIAFPLMAESSDELLFMLNQWDGCCIGVPPSPFDAVEVTLVAPVKMEGGINIFNYGTITGKLKVDPYVVNNWLVGLYLMEDAQLDLE